jgi:hypothetical protein
MSNRFHLADINIARMLAPLDDPIMADFVNNLDRINALADNSEGFVWRLQTEDGDATALRAFEDDRIIVNMSVWDSIESLHGYVYRSDHTAIFRRRRDWFSVMDQHVLALWWIPAGHIPTVDDAKIRLDHLDKNGPTPYAFTFKKRFTAEELLVFQSTPSGD